MLGRKATLIYLGSLLVIAWLAGWFFNASLSTETIDHSAHQHGAMQPALWQHASGIALILILLLSLYASRKPKQATKSCCSE